MAKLTLYHAAPSRSSIVHWMLEEVGEPFDIHPVSFKKGENLRPDYLAVNPMGKVPALRHGEVVITEAAAICCYLADEFPQTRLNIPIGDPRRGPYLKWLFFAPSCIEPAITERAFPRKEPVARSTLGFGDFDTVMDVLANATAASRPYLMGEQFTAADVVVGSSLRWGMAFKLIPERPQFVPMPAASTSAPRTGAQPKGTRSSGRSRRLLPDGHPSSRKLRRGPKLTGIEAVVTHRSRFEALLAMWLASLGSQAGMTVGSGAVTASAPAERSEPAPPPSAIRCRRLSNAARRG